MSFTQKVLKNDPYFHTLLKRKLNRFCNVDYPNSVRMTCKVA